MVTNLFSKIKTGFSKEHILDDDDEWLIYWQPVGKGELVIAVGQELEYREELVNKMVFSQTGIWFAGLPVLLFGRVYCDLSCIKTN